MTSSRLILIFLAFIFLIIVILSSNRISNALRTRFGKMIPVLTPVSEDLTPTPTIEATSPTPTPTIIYGGGNTKNGGGNAKTGSLAKQIPATGPAALVWLLLGGSFAAGVALKKLTTQKS